MATFPSPASGGGLGRGCASRAADLGDRRARFFPRLPNYLQVFETCEGDTSISCPSLDKPPQPAQPGERRQIGDLRAAEREPLQPAQPGERRQIGDWRAAEKEALQPAQPGERRQIGDWVPSSQSSCSPLSPASGARSATCVRSASSRCNWLSEESRSRRSRFVPSKSSQWMNGRHSAGGARPPGSCPERAFRHSPGPARPPDRLRQSQRRHAAFCERQIGVSFHFRDNLSDPLPHHAGSPHQRFRNACCPGTQRREKVRRQIGRGFHRPPQCREIDSASRRPLVPSAPGSARPGSIRHRNSPAPADAVGRWRSPRPADLARLSPHRAVGDAIQQRAGLVAGHARNHPLGEVRLSRLPAHCLGGFERIDQADRDNAGRLLQSLQRRRAAQIGIARRNPQFADAAQQLVEPIGRLRPR